MCQGVSGCDWVRVCHVAPSTPVSPEQRCPRNALGPHSTGLYISYFLFLLLIIYLLLIY